MAKEEGNDNGYDKKVTRMIEFELKFQLQSSKYKILDSLKNKCVLEQYDTYFDTIDGMLYENGNFLRLRNNRKVDFKLYAGDDSHLFCDETSFDLESFNFTNLQLLYLLSRLKINTQKFHNFSEFCKNTHLTIIAPIKKTRREYHINDIVLSVDEVKDLGYFLEVERSFSDINFDKLKAQKVLTETLINMNIIDPSVDKPLYIGYVELYLLSHNKALYEKGKYKR